jgi:hypothetical protein
VHRVPNILLSYHTKANLVPSKAEISLHRRPQRTRAKKITAILSKECAPPILVSRQGTNQNGWGCVERAASIGIFGRSNSPALLLGASCDRIQPDNNASLPIGAKCLGILDNKLVCGRHSTRDSNSASPSMHLARLQSAGDRVRAGSKS